MEYTKKYSADDLFDMFANEADVVKLANMTLASVMVQLTELAPDMTDTREVAATLLDTAHKMAYPHG